MGDGKVVGILAYTSENGFMLTIVLEVVENVPIEVCVLRMDRHQSH